MRYQQEGRGRERDMEADTFPGGGHEGDQDCVREDDEPSQVEAMKEIRTALEKMMNLRQRISELLKEHEGRRRRLTAVDKLILRYWEFIRVELNDIVASLNQMGESSKLGSDELTGQLVSKLIDSISGCLDRSQQRSSRPSAGFIIRTRKYRRRTSCLNRATRKLLHPGYLRYQCQRLMRRCQCTCSNRATPIPRPDESCLRFLYSLAESHLMYKHLLQDDDGDGNSKTSSSYTAEGGDTFLVGNQAALRNKQLRWFMVANRKADKKTDLKIISMVGPAGVGKTALAMEIYRQLQQNEARSYFQCCVTVKVSRKPDKIELLKHILLQIDEQAALASEAAAERSQITTLEHEIHPSWYLGVHPSWFLENNIHPSHYLDRKLAHDINQRLQGKRYLVVIDDIWKKSDWDILKEAFPRNSSGSRIVITTQIRSLAQQCCSYSSDGLVYEVKPLTEVDSAQLLCRKAFGFEDGCLPENLKLVCEEILRRCGGIPLFITGMADWLRERQQEVHHISINSPEYIPQLLKQFEPRVSPTYDDLPCLSKFLLLHMNMFPVGYMFDKDDLIRKWIDHGLSFPERLEKAEECFSMLANRNVITRVESNEHSYVVEDCHWQVSYFMQQFLANKAAEKGMFFTSATLTSKRTGRGKTLRRLSLHQPDPELPALLGDMDLSHTHSLFISGKVDGIPLDKFSHLMVLDLEGWQGLNDKDLLLICKMFLLQYLILRKTAGVSKLPPQIKELVYLRTLDISHTQISELPSQVCELERLKTLDLRSTQVRQLPKQIRNIWALQCLLIGGDRVNHYETGTEILEEIVNQSLATTVEYMNELRVLAITCSFHQCTDGRFQQALRSSLDILGSTLKSLTIHCGLGCCMDFLDSMCENLQKFKVTSGRFTRLPQWFLGVDRLNFLEITVCTLPPDDLRILGNLPGLKCLVLGLHFIPEAEIVIDGEGFQKLESMSFTCRVPWLNFSERAMSSLTYLELNIAGSIASQESVPSGVSNLKRLSDVAICYHPNYTNSPSVKMTVEAVRKGVAEMPINLFINGIEDQEGYVQAAVEEEVAARASTSQSEIEEEE